MSDMHMLHDVYDTLCIHYIIYITLFVGVCIVKKITNRILKDKKDILRD